LVTGVDLDKVTAKESDIESSIGKTTEERWGRVLTGLLHEVDPAIDPAHLSHLPAQDVQPKVYTDKATSAFVAPEDLRNIGEDFGNTDPAEFESGRNPGPPDSLQVQ
jgi:hypothetical protein